MGRIYKYIEIFFYPLFLFFTSSSSALASCMYKKVSDLFILKAFIVAHDQKSTRNARFSSPLKKPNDYLHPI